MSGGGGTGDSRSDRRSARLGCFVFPELLLGTELWNNVLERYENDIMRVEIMGL